MNESAEQSAQEQPEQQTKTAVNRADVLSLASWNVEIHRDSSSHGNHKYGNYSIYSPQDIVNIYGLT